MFVLIRARGIMVAPSAFGQRARRGYALWSWIVQPPMHGYAASTLDRSLSRYARARRADGGTRVRRALAVGISLLLRRLLPRAATGRRLGALDHREVARRHRDAPASHVRSRAAGRACDRPDCALARPVRSRRRHGLSRRRVRWARRLAQTADATHGHRPGRAGSGGGGRRRADLDGGPARRARQACRSPRPSAPVLGGSALRAMPHPDEGLGGRMGPVGPAGIAEAGARRASEYLADPGSKGGARGAT